MIKYDFIAFAACNIDSMSNSVTICLLFACNVFTFFFFLNFPASQLGVGAYLQPYRTMDREEMTTNGHGYINTEYITKDVLCFFQDDPL